MRTKNGEWDYIYANKLKCLIFYVLTNIPSEQILLLGKLSHQHSWLNIYFATLTPWQGLAQRKQLCCPPLWHEGCNGKCFDLLSLFCTTMQIATNTNCIRQRSDVWVSFFLFFLSLFSICCWSQASEKSKANQPTKQIRKKKKTLVLNPGERWKPKHAPWTLILPSLHILIPTMQLRVQLTSAIKIPGDHFLVHEQETSFLEYSILSPPSLSSLKKVQIFLDSRAGI